MMLKKLSSLLCVLLIIASFAVTCLAQPATENGIGNNGVGTLLTASLSAKAASGKQTYTIEIDGNDAIGTEEKVYTTLVITDNNGKEHGDIQLRIKKDESGKGVLRITNRTGNRIHYNSNNPYIKQSMLSNSTAFEIIFTNNTLVVNKITLIEDVKRISYESPIDLDNNSKPETTSSTNESLSTASADNELDTSKQADKNEKADNGGNKKAAISKTTIIAIVAVVAVAVLGTVGFIVIRKHKVDTKPQFEPKYAIESKSKKKIKDEKRTSKNDVVSINKAKTSIKEHDNFSRIPVGIAEPIRYTVYFEYEKTSDLTEEAVMNESTNSQTKMDTQSVVDVFLGKADISLFPETCLPILLMNSYDLSISDLMAPYFRVSSDKENAKYVVVDDEKLYVNPLKYNGNNFKAYSDLTCLDKCFTIMCDNNEVKPQGQKIINIEPAFLEKSGNDYILVKKGLLNVE